MRSPPASDHGSRFPPDIISHAVGWETPGLSTRCASRSRVATSSCGARSTRTVTSWTSSCPRTGIGEQRPKASDAAKPPGGPSPSTTDHRPAARLRRRGPHRDAVGGPRHRSGREHSRGGFSSPDTTAGAPDAAVHVDRSAPTIRVGARDRAASRPSQSTPPAVGAPPPAPHQHVR